MTYLWEVYITRASLVAQLVKNLPAMQETWVQSLHWEDILEKGRSPEVGKGYPLQCSGLENSTERIVHGVCKESDTTERLSRHFTYHKTSQRSGSQKILLRELPWRSSG